MTSTHTRNAVLAQLIKNRIATAGTSVNAVSVHTSMSEATLRRKLGGSKHWTIDEVAEVAAQLNTTASELLTAAESGSR